MAGLLDQFTNMSPDQSSGLLAAASQILQQSGDPRRPFGLGQAMGSGIASYQGSMVDAKRRKEEEAQLAIQKQMMGMKMRDAQSDYANQEALRKRAAGLQSVYSQLGQSGVMNPQGQTPASHMDGGQIVKAAQAAGMPADVGSLNQTVDMINRGQISPQSAQQQPSPAAANDLFAQKIGFAKQLRAAGYHPEADAEEEKALKFREEYSLDLKNLQGPDGKLRPYQVSKFGGVRDTGLGVAPKMAEMKLGDRSQWIDENTVAPGQQFQMGQSQDSRASERSAAAGRAQSASQFNQRMSQERQQPRGQIVQTDQGPMLADPRAGTARPLTGMDGQPIGPKMRAVPNQIQRAYIENGSSLRKVQAALDAVESYPDALGVSNYLGDNIRQRTDPSGVSVRALVADIGSQKIHDRSGAAVTASETPRLKPFIPAATDNPETVKKKLKMFQSEYQAMQTEMEGMYGEDMGYRPLGKGDGASKPPAAAAPTMAAMPTANASNKGKTLKDHETGKRYQSNGMQWKEVN